MLVFATGDQCYRIHVLELRVQPPEHFFLGPVLVSSGPQSQYELYKARSTSKYGLSLLTPKKLMHVNTMIDFLSCLRFTKCVSIQTWIHQTFQTLRMPVQCRLSFKSVNRVRKFLWTKDEHCCHHDLHPTSAFCLHCPCDRSTPTAPTRCVRSGSSLLFHFMNITI